MTNPNDEWLCHVLSLKRRARSDAPYLFVKRRRARSDSPYLFVLIRVDSWLNEKQIGAQVQNEGVRS